MKLPAHGLDPERVLAALDAFKANDLDWRDGRTWAYVYPAGEQVQRAAEQGLLRYLTENALDPTVFPSCTLLENQLVAIGAAHLGGDEEVAGSFTTGGTESILLAVKTARDRARVLRPEITQPELVLPVTAHAAFHKACAYFDVKPVLVDVDPTTFRATAAAMEAAITPSTVMLVASAPSYAHGVVDDVVGIAAVGKARGLLVHVDACMGGWLLPYFRRLGADVPPFDFSVDGVTSISMDLHKYAFCPKGASLLLWRSRELRRFQIFSCSNWTGYTVVNPTMLSTRSGGPMAAAWTTLHVVGDEGYLERARVILESQRKVVAGCDAVPGLRVMGRPDFCLISITSDEVDVFQVVDAMKRRGWFIQAQLGFGRHRENFHISIHPGVAPNTDTMLADLADAVAEVRRLPKLDVVDPVKAVLATLDGGRLSPEAFHRLVELGGVHGAALPEGMAAINTILQALPVAVNEQVLAWFMGELQHLTPEQRALAEHVRTAIAGA